MLRLSSFHPLTPMDAMNMATHVTSMVTQKYGRYFMSDADMLSRCALSERRRDCAENDNDETVR